MDFKLAPRFNRRLFLIIHRKQNCYYFQIQDEVARHDGLCAGIYRTFSKLENPDIGLLGEYVIKLIKRFEEISDYTEEQIISLTGMTIKEYEETDLEIAKDCFNGTYPADESVSDKYDICNIKYLLDKCLYSFYYEYTERYRGRKNLEYAKNSFGQPGVLTFDTALEFAECPEPEELGKMVMEALDRSRRLTDKALGNRFPDADIELLDGRILTVGHPRDRHFGDFDDEGESYKTYGYCPSYDSEPTAYFFIAFAAELDLNLSEENVKNTWETIWCKADEFKMESVNFGIYRFRAEMRCKKCHRISYYVQSDEGLILECGMEVISPGRRKKVDEKLSELFEDFAANGRYK